MIPTGFASVTSDPPGFAQAYPLEYIVRWQKEFDGPLHQEDFVLAFSRLIDY